VDLILKQSSKNKGNLKEIIQQVFTKDLFLDGPIFGDVLWPITKKRILASSTSKLNLIGKKLFN